MCIYIYICIEREIYRYIYIERERYIDSAPAVRSSGFLPPSTIRALPGSFAAKVDICMYLCIYVSMYLCVYVSMYLCIYVSMCLCIDAKVDRHFLQ